MWGSLGSQYLFYSFGQLLSGAYCVYVVMLYSMGTIFDALRLTAAYILVTVEY